MLPKELQFTYSDYKDFPEDGKRYEILEGGLLMVPSPFSLHQAVSINLAFSLVTHVKENKLGKIFCAPFDVVLSEITVVQPDIIFISTNNSGILTEENIKGVPDILMEIISKSSRKNDEILKKRIYAQSGVNEYWIIDPEHKQIEIYMEPHKGYTLWKKFSSGDIVFTPTFPKLNLSLTELFVL